MKPEPGPAIKKAPTPPQNAPLDRLRRIQEVHRIAVSMSSCDPDLAADLAWHADALAAILDGGADPARAFGLRRGPGNRKPETLASLQARDRLLRQARAVFLHDMDLGGAARALVAAATRAARTKHPAPGSLNALLAEAAKHAGIPSSAKRLRAILEVCEPTREMN